MSSRISLLWFVVVVASCSPVVYTPSGLVARLDERPFADRGHYVDVEGQVLRMRSVPQRELTSSSWATAVAGVAVGGGTSRERTIYRGVVEIGSEVARVVCVVREGDEDHHLGDLRRGDVIHVVGTLRTFDAEERAAMLEPCARIGRGPPNTLADIVSR